MKESKIDLTERLRREGRWTEASKFKDETVQQLRAEGLKRAEAANRAWKKTEEAYPPLPSTESFADTPANDGPQADDEVREVMETMICDAAEAEIDLWQQKYGVALHDDARAALVGEELMYFWAMGLMGEMPNQMPIRTNTNDQPEQLRCAETAA